MKKLVFIFGISGLVLACGSTQTKETAVKTTTTEKADVTTYANSITEAELKEALYTYASDEFEGRETGQPGQKKAVEYLKNHYVSLGIPSPISKDDYFQEVPLQVMNTPKVNLTVNNKEFKAIDDFVSVTSSPNGKLDLNEVIYAGFGIDDEKYSSYKDIDVTGKVVLIKSGEPKTGDNFIISGSEEASKWSNFRQEFVAKREAAEAKGAKAVMFYYPSIYPMVAQRFGNSSGRMALKGQDDGMYYFLINTDMAKAILSDIETNEKSQSIAAPFALDYTNDTKEFNSENVVALIKGSEKPDEVIVISAHLDHEGIKDGEIYNGADDDGSGTVALLEIAEAFKTAKNNGHGPKRSILFLHVTGEEKGLLGSAYYTDVDPIISLENTVADLNIDMIGRVDKDHEENRNFLYLIGSDKLSTELHNISEEMNAKYTNIELDYTYNDENDPNRYYYRSDHYNFAKNNVPVIFYFNGTHDDYHQPSDTPDKIEYDLLENRTRLVFYTAWELANRENRITVDKTGK